MDLEGRLARRVMRTCKRYELLAPDDHLLVAVSGGKDSYTLLYLLRIIQERAPFSFRITAVHLDQMQPGYDGEPVCTWLKNSGVPFEILQEDTYSVVTSHLEPDEAYCSLCARLRRGVLYTAAQRIGCNKIALGHHREDALETFLLNLFYSGRLQAMPAIYRTNDDTLSVIRPMIECAEAEIAAFAKEAEFPVIPCGLCHSQASNRDRMSELIAMMEELNPNVRNIMLAALKNVRPTHLLDRNLLQAWEERDPSIRPDPPPAEREEHAAALPILRG